MSLGLPRSRAGRIGALLLAALAVLAGPVAAAAQDGSLDQPTFEIAGQLRCPVCVSESVADSNSRVAIEMRDLIQAQLEEGRSEAEVLAFFQERYGDWILLEPPRRGVHLWVWLLPVVVAAVGVGALALLVRRWLHKGREAPDVDECDLDRVRDAMARETSTPAESRAAGDRS